MTNTCLPCTKCVELAPVSTQKNVLAKRHTSAIRGLSKAAKALAYFQLALSPDRYSALPVSAPFHTQYYLTATLAAVTFGERWAETTCSILKHLNLKWYVDRAFIHYKSVIFIPFPACLDRRPYLNTKKG